MSTYCQIFIYRIWRHLRLRPTTRCEMSERECEWRRLSTRSQGDLQIVLILKYMLKWVSHAVSTIVMCCEWTLNRCTHELMKAIDEIIDIDDSWTDVSWHSALIMTESVIKCVRTGKQNIVACQCLKNVSTSSAVYRGTSSIIHII